MKRILTLNIDAQVFGTRLSLIRCVLWNFITSLDILIISNKTNGQNSKIAKIEIPVMLVNSINQNESTKCFFLFSFNLFRREHLNRQNRDSINVNASIQKKKKNLNMRA